VNVLRVFSRARLLTLGLTLAAIAAPQAAQAADTTPPVVTWAAPTAGAAVTGQLSESAGNCYVNASDASGINHVQFYLDGRALNDEHYAPYSCSWDTSTATSGTHTLSATAYDSAGNSSSASRTVQVSSGSVLWKADAESPLVNEWAEYSTSQHCAVTSDTVSSDGDAFRESSVVAKGSYAYEFIVHDGDNCYGERAEIGQALPSRTNFSESRLFNEGDDRWISFQVNLGSDYPVNTPNWNLIAQWKHLAVPNVVGVSPEVSLEVHNGHYYLSNNGNAAWMGPTATTGRWAKFTFHIKFSSNPSVGFVQIFGDPDGTGVRQLLAPKYMNTLSHTTGGTPVPGHSRIGIYRNSAISGTAHLYYDGYTVATSQAAAQANAF
jgi:Polysaccharide lyase/Bacterial Ig domain